MTRRVPTTRRALTLVELLAALSLLALLTVGLLAVTRATARDAALQSGAGAPPAWRDRLGRRLADDLAQSLTVAPGPGGLELQGWSGRDPVTLAPRHRPLRIVWRLGADRLWREARPLAGGTLATGPARALAAAGIAAFVIDRGAVHVRFTDPALAPLVIRIPLRGAS